MRYILPTPPGYEPALLLPIISAIISAIGFALAYVLVLLDRLAAGGVVDFAVLLRGLV